MGSVKSVKGNCQISDERDMMTLGRVRRKIPSTAARCSPTSERAYSRGATGTRERDPKQIHRFQFSGSSKQVIFFCYPPVHHMTTTHSCTAAETTISQTSRFRGIGYRKMPHQRGSKVHWKRRKNRTSEKGVFLSSFQVLSPLVLNPDKTACVADMRCGQHLPAIN